MIEESEREEARGFPYIEVEEEAAVVMVKEERSSCSVIAVTLFQQQQCPCLKSQDISSYLENRMYSWGMARLLKSEMRN